MGATMKEELTIEYIKKRRAEGAKWREIAEETGKTLRETEALFTLYKRRQARENPVGNATCIACKKPFMSESKFIKICPGCKKKSVMSWIAA